MITEEKFEAEFQKWNSFLVSVLTRKGVHRDIAEDVTQNAWVRAWRFREQFRENATFGTWMYHVHHSTWLDYCRKRKMVQFEEKHTDRLVVVPNEVEAITDTQRLLRVLDDIDELPEVYREVVKLRLMGLPDKEISARTGLKINTIKTKARRGLMLLKKGA